MNEKNVNPAKAGRWLPLLLIPVVLALFWPALLRPTAILYPTFSQFSDTMVIHWPKAWLMAHSWQSYGDLPHWTPLILSGMPLAANQLAMLSYPPAWLFLVLPLEPTFNLLFVFHLLLGGFGIYFLLRKGYQTSAGAALLGGLTFALNGKWLAHAAGGHVSMVGAIGWMPWALLGVAMLINEEAKRHGGEEAKSRGSDGLRRVAWGLLVAVALAMQIVTHTLPLIYSTYLIAAMVVFYFLGVRGQGSGVRGQRSGVRGQELGVRGEGLEFRVQSSELGDSGQPSAVSGQDAKSHRVVESQKNTSHVPRSTSHAPRTTSLFPSFILHPSSLFLLIPAFGLAVLLGAGQLLPLLELTPYSNRALTLAQAAEYSVSPVQLLVGLLLPSAQGGHEYVIYLGLLPLLLAPFGLSWCNRWSWFYAGVLIFAVLFALGPYTPVHWLFYSFAPGFSWVRTPARMFFVGAIAASVLVGFAVDRLNSARWSPGAKRWFTRLALAGGLLALLLGLGLALTIEPVRWAGLGLALVVPVGLALLALRVHRLLPAHWFTLLLSLLLFIDLAWFDASLMRFVPRDEALAPGRPAAEYLAGQPGQFRVYSPSYSLPMQTAAAHNLHLADGVEPVHLAAYDQFMARAGGYNQAGFSVTIPHFGDGPLETALKGVEPNLKLLGLLNVRYLAAAFPMTWDGLTPATEVDGAYIYANQHALPRAWVAHQTLPLEADWLAQLERLPDLGNVALVEHGPQPSGLSGLASPVSITHYTPDAITLETHIAEPGWLVLSELWYPGWQAMVNGVSQPVERVNGLLRGIYLAEPGQYTVVVEYRPASIIWGNRIAGATAVGLVILVVAGGLWWRSNPA